MVNCKRLYLIAFLIIFVFINHSQIKACNANSEILKSVNNGVSEKVATWSSCDNNSFVMEELDEQVNEDHQNENNFIELHISNYNSLNSLIISKNSIKSLFHLSSTSVFLKNRILRL